MHALRTAISKRLDQNTDFPGDKVGAQASESKSRSLTAVLWIAVIPHRIHPSLIFLSSMALLLAAWVSHVPRRWRKNSPNLELVNLSVSFRGTDFLTNTFCRYEEVTWDICPENVRLSTCRKLLIISSHSFGSVEDIASVVQGSFMFPLML